MPRSPGRFIAVFLLACLQVGCLASLRGRQADMVGRAAPALELSTFDGRRVQLVELGHPTLLVFMASWCAPSKAEAERVAELARRYRRRGLRVVGVAIGEDEGPEAVRRFVEQRNIPFPVVMGTPEARAAYGGTPVTPTVFIVGPEGRIERQVVGMREMGGLEAAVARLMDAG
jgi:thiol-disulfide isomerase/thioredoxin